MERLETLPSLFVWVLPIAVLAFVVLSQVVRILREYERGVVFRLGKLLQAKGPGLITLIPLIDRMVRVDLRVVVLAVPKQEMMTRDNVPLTVDAVVYFRVVEPQAAIIRVENFLGATSRIAQTTLRHVIGQAELDELLAQRERINQRLQAIIDGHTDPWGIKVTGVELKDVALPDTMRRAMAGQAESERERRAKIIDAEGEFQAAAKLVEAGRLMATQPVALQLRYLCKPCAKFRRSAARSRCCRCLSNRLQPSPEKAARTLANNGDRAKPEATEGSEARSGLLEEGFGRWLTF